MAALAPAALQPAKPQRRSSQDEARKHNAMSTLFQKLLSGELPCAKVYEDELVFAFMDAGQVNDGHVIVATKAPRETLARSAMPWVVAAW